MGIRIWFLTVKTLYQKIKVSTFFWGLHKCIWTIQHQSLNQRARLNMAFKNETDKGSQRIPWLLFCHEVMSDSLWPHRWHHTRLPCPSLSLRVCSTSCPLSQWCHPTSHPLLSLSLPAFNLSHHQGLFPINQFFASGGQSIGASASVSILPVNIQGWFPLGLTGLISLPINSVPVKIWNIVDQVWIMKRKTELLIYFYLLNWSSKKKSEKQCPYGSLL